MANRGGRAGSPDLSGYGAVETIRRLPGGAVGGYASRRNGVRGLHRSRGFRRRSLGASAGKGERDRDGPPRDLPRGGAGREDRARGGVPAGSRPSKPWCVGSRRGRAPAGRRLSVGVERREPLALFLELVALPAASRRNGSSRIRSRSCLQVPATAPSTRNVGTDCGTLAWNTLDRCSSGRIWLARACTSSVASQVGGSGPARPYRGSAAGPVGCRPEAGPHRRESGAAPCARGRPRQGPPVSRSSLPPRPPPPARILEVAAGESLEALVGRDVRGGPSQSEAVAYRSARRCSQVPAGGTRTRSSQRPRPLNVAESMPSISSCGTGPTFEAWQRAATAASTSRAVGLPRWARSQDSRRGARSPIANGQKSPAATRWIVTRMSVACTTVRRSSARVSWSRRKSRKRDQRPMYIDGAYCAWMPPIRSSVFASGYGLRSSSSCRSAAPGSARAG